MSEDNDDDCVIISSDYDKPASSTPVADPQRASIMERLCPSQIRLVMATGYEPRKKHVRKDDLRAYRPHPGLQLWDQLKNLPDLSPDTIKNTVTCDLCGVFIDKKEMKAHVKAEHPSGKPLMNYLLPPMPPIIDQRPQLPISLPMPQPTTNQPPQLLIPVLLVPPNPNPQLPILQPAVPPIMNQMPQLSSLMQAVNFEGPNFQIPVPMAPPIVDRSPQQPPVPASPVIDQKPQLPIVTTDDEPPASATVSMVQPKSNEAAGVQTVQQLMIKCSLCNFYGPGKAVLEAHFSAYHTRPKSSSTGRSTKLVGANSHSGPSCSKNYVANTNPSIEKPSPNPDVQNSSTITARQVLKLYRKRTRMNGEGGTAPIQRNIKKESTDVIRAIADTVEAVVAKPLTEQEATDLVWLKRVQKMARSKCSPFLPYSKDKSRLVPSQNIVRSILSKEKDASRCEKQKVIEKAMTNSLKKIKKISDPMLSPTSSNGLTFDPPNRIGKSSDFQSSSKQNPRSHMKITGYSCSICSHVSPSYAAWKLHTDQQHRVLHSSMHHAYKCVCGFAADTERKLWLHNARCSTSACVNCLLCTYVARDTAKLYLHVKMAHNGNYPDEARASDSKEEDHMVTSAISCSVKQEVGSEETPAALTVLEPKNVTLFSFFLAEIDDMDEYAMASQSAEQMLLESMQEDPNAQDNSNEKETRSVEPPLNSSTDQSGTTVLQNLVTKVVGLIGNISTTTTLSKDKVDVITQLVSSIKETIEPEKQ